MIETLTLAGALRRQLATEAAHAFPRECCGLIEGVVKPFTLSPSKGPLTLSPSKGDAVALHPMPNVAPESDRFEIDPAAHIALLRGLRGTGRGIIGCYHSHPNGRAEPSAHDLASAVEAGFLWLIAALDRADAEPRLGAFVSTGSALAPVRIETH